MITVTFLRGTALLYAALICLARVEATDGPEAYLVSGRQSQYAIVLPASPIPAERTAAEELQYHIKRMSRVELAIVSEDEYESGPMVAVGFNNKLPPALRPDKFGELGAEELIIQAEGDVLLLAGGRPRGTLYAVYEFLHRLGVRWYTPEYTRIPHLRSIPLPREAFRYRPPIRMRAMAAGNAPTRAWAARNRQNQYLGLWSDPGEEYGGGWAEGPDMHTFWRIMPESHLRAHPDWAAEVDGERRPPAGNRSWGLCLRPEVRRYLVDRTMEYARSHPNIKVIWIGQNDGSPYCTCEYCQRFYDEHGGNPSSLIVQLLNELADAVAAEMPDRMVKTLAYSWSQDPPEGMTLRDNAIIMFCAGADYYKPIATNPATEELRRRIAAWREICSNISVYLYSYPHDNYWFPAPCLYSAADNIRWAYQSGVRDVYSQISGWMNWYGSELVHMRAWVYSRLMWDPNSDVKALVEDFARGYYGPAADAVLEAIALVHEDVFDENGQMRQYSDSLVAPHYLDPRKIRQVNQMMEETYNSLRQDRYKHRLSFAWIPFLWADVWLGFTDLGTYDETTGTWAVPMADGDTRSRYGRLVKRFMTEHKVEAVKEIGRLDPSTLALDKMGVPWRAYRLQEGAVQAVVVPEVAGHIVEFADTQLGLSVLKPAWYGQILQYPMTGPWPDFVNGRSPTAYEVTSDEGNRVTLSARIGNIKVQKEVSIAEGVLHGDLSATATEGADVQIQPRPMFKMDDGVFGDAPAVYIEKRDGTWSKTVLGEGLGDFWWAEGHLDIADATGRIVIASSTRPAGLLLRFNPDEVEYIEYWYERYDPHPAGLSYMFQLHPTSPKRSLAAGESIELGLQLQIVPDALAIVESRTAD